MSPSDLIINGLFSSVSLAVLQKCHLVGKCAVPSGAEVERRKLDLERKDILRVSQSVLWSLHCKQYASIKQAS